MKLELNQNQTNIVTKGLMSMAQDFQRYAKESKTEGKKKFFESYQTDIEDIYFKILEGAKQ